LTAPLTVDLGAEICGSLDVAAEREWLVTNGLGGFACGTVAGALTRRYHGLLIAAESRNAPNASRGVSGDAPGGIASRMLLVAKFDETLHYDGHAYELGANRWKSGGAVPVIAPDGFRFIERFHLQGTTPVWTFACADALIEKRVWMQDGANTTYVRYDLVRSSAVPAELEVKALVNYRDIHSTTMRTDFARSGCMEITAVPHGLQVIARAGATPFYLLNEAAEAEPRREWYLNFDLAEERVRGLDDHEDHLLAGIFRARLTPGESLTFVLSTDAEPSLDGRAALASRVALEEELMEHWIAAQPQASLDAPQWIRQLVLAAAQFPVRLPSSRSANSAEQATYSVIAGYPWFGAWGRDTMIAVPGLTIETGRPDLARSILRRAAKFVNQGMLPNVFPDAGQPALYNSVDATLWYFDAVRQYYDATSDRAFITELFPVLADMIDHYVRGTRYAIRLDEADGLLHAGEPGVQLTWMDAKVGSQVITARIGKPVEVNALWYNALRTMARFAFALDKPTWDFSRLAERAQAGFARFWNAQAGCCFDVLDGPAGPDAALRPNQIFAVSLPESPLSAEQRAAVVDICMRRLLTSCGLRSLDPADSHYQGHYGGPPAQRDAVYHEGTAWAWLLGPFVLAHLRVHHDPQGAFTFLEPVANHLLAYGLGTVSEIFDGDPPFAPRGAMSQAWSVAEVLRAWRACYDAGLTARPLPRRL
jgi:predicted glycogen debranching enzyme